MHIHRLKIAYLLLDQSICADNILLNILDLIYNFTEVLRSLRTFNWVTREITSDFTSLSYSSELYTIPYLSKTGSYT